MDRGQGIGIRGQVAPTEWYAASSLSPVHCPIPPDGMAASFSSFAFDTLPGVCYDAAPLWPSDGVRPWSGKGLSFGRKGAASGPFCEGAAHEASVGRPDVARRSRAGMLRTMLGSGSRPPSILLSAAALYADLCAVGPLPTSQSVCPGCGSAGGGRPGRHSPGQQPPHAAGPLTRISQPTTCATSSPGVREKYGITPVIHAWAIPSLLRAVKSEVLLAMLALRDRLGGPLSSSPLAA